VRQEDSKLLTTRGKKYPRDFLASTRAFVK
jgi:hypothetical protein